MRRYALVSGGSAANVRSDDLVVDRPVDLERQPQPMPEEPILLVDPGRSRHRVRRRARP